MERLEECAETRVDGSRDGGLVIVTCRARHDVVTEELVKLARLDDANILAKEEEALERELKDLEEAAREERRDDLVTRSALLCNGDIASESEDLGVGIACGEGGGEGRKGSLGQVRAIAQMPAASTAARDAPEAWMLSTMPAAIWTSPAKISRPAEPSLSASRAGDTTSATLLASVTATATLLACVKVSRTLSSMASFF